MKRYENIVLLMIVLIIFVQFFPVQADFIGDIYTDERWLQNTGALPTLDDHILLNSKQMQKTENSTTIWVDDDFNYTSCKNLTWGFNAFDSIQSAIFSADMNSTTAINIEPGNYYERITIDRPVSLNGNTSQNGEVLTNISGEFGEEWALICVSANDMGDSDQFQDRDCFPAQGLQAYYILKSRGYKDDHIILMLWHDDENSTPTYDCEPNDDDNGVDEYISIYNGTNNWLYGPDGINGTSDDPEIDVDNLNVTKLSLKQQIKNLSNLVGPNDHVTFYFVNHGRKNGTPERCQIYFEDNTSGPEDQYLDAETLDSWLDEIKCKRMNIFIDMCRTQNFINSSNNLTLESNRLIIGASGGLDNIAHAWFNARPTHFAGSWFFHPFWNAIAAEYSVRDAYEFALYQSDRMAEDYPFPYQFPILIDKIRDSDKYSLLPYAGNIIRILNVPNDSIEITNCSIIGELGQDTNGPSSTNGTNCISLYSNDVNIAQTLINDSNIGFFDKTINSTYQDSIFFHFFPINQSLDNDSFMISGEKIFSRIFINITLLGGGTDGNYVIEYATDRNEWLPLTILSDTTDNLSKMGNITFNPPLNWSYQAHNHSSMETGSEYGYWIRLRLLEKYSKLPQADFIELSYYSNAKLMIKDNQITSHDYGINLNGFSSELSGDVLISDCHIMYNDIKSINKYGVYIWLSEKNEICNNNFKSCNWSAIHINESNNNQINRNICTKSGYGISSLHLDFSIISDNRCTSNTRRGMFIGNSNYVSVQDNICNFNNWSGIHIYESNNIKLNNNKCINNDYGISVTDSNENKIINNSCISNLKRGIYLSFSNRIILSRNNCSLNNWSSIRLWFSDYNLLDNNICDQNQYSGISLNSSSNNIFTNCSVDQNLNYDFYITSNSKKNVLINTTFNKISILNESSDLTVKNYLHLQVTHHAGEPIAGADMKIKDNSRIIYSTPGFGGNKPKTNSKGQIKWVLITDRIYSGNIYPIENVTMIRLEFENITFWDNYRDIDMSTSHFEYFYPNSIPEKIILEGPGNNSIINVSSLKFKWRRGIDINNDVLNYKFQLNGLNTSWISPLIEEDTIPADHNWTYISGLVDGPYKWRVCAYDNLQNGTWSEVWDFVIDTQAPTSTLSEPGKNKIYNDLNLIIGQAIDPLGGTGIKSVEVKILKNSDHKSWNGFSWSMEDNWLKAEGNLNWSYDTTSIPWQSGLNYTIQSRAIDLANNIEIPTPGNKFYIDSDPPDSIILQPINNSYLNKLFNISGISLDIGVSGLERIEICIEEYNNKSNNRFWHGDKWSAGEHWLNTTGTSNWYYDANGVEWTSDFYYSIKVRAVDQIGNLEIPDKFTSFMFDDLPPNISIEINKGEYYSNSVFITLDLWAFDSGSGLNKVAYSIDSSTWSSWGDYETFKEYVLPTGDGVKSIYYMVKDNANNSVRTNDSIKLDTTAPESLVIIINNGHNETNNTLVELVLSAYDTLSGVHQMSFSEDKILWSNWINYSETAHYNLSMGDGDKIIYFRVKDFSGNIAKPVWSTIILNQTVPKDNDTVKKDEPKLEDEHDTDYNFYYYLVFLIIIIVLILISFKILRGKTLLPHKNNRDLTKTKYDIDDQTDSSEIQE
jgi:parallel beta-helix repeat protein